MRVFVKNKNVMQAYRILMKRMNKDADFRESRKPARFVPNGVKRRIKEHAGRRRWFVKREKIEQKLRWAETAHLRRKRKKRK